MYATLPTYSITDYLLIVLRVLIARRRRKFWAIRDQNGAKNTVSNEFRAYFCVLRSIQNQKKNSAFGRKVCYFPLVPRSAKTRREIIQGGNNLWNSSDVRWIKSVVGGSHGVAGTACICLVYFCRLNVASNRGLQRRFADQPNLLPNRCNLVSICNFYLITT